MRDEATDRIRAEIDRATALELEAYLAGAAHDATRSRIHRTTRFCQSGRDWVEVLALILGRLGKRAWIYKEGADRSCWVVESTWESRVTEELPAAPYARGYFDAEGGIPRDLGARFYVQFVQKNLSDLSRLRTRIESLGIACGSIHNPSARIDPEYWRFYIRARSQAEFVGLVRSWHPRKRSLLEARS